VSAAIDQLNNIFGTEESAAPHLHDREFARANQVVDRSDTDATKRATYCIDRKQSSFVTHD